MFTITSRLENANKNHGTTLHPLEWLSPQNKTRQKWTSAGEDADKPAPVTFLLKLVLQLCIFYVYISNLCIAHENKNVTIAIENGW